MQKAFKIILALSLASLLAFAVAGCTAGSAANGKNIAVKTASASRHELETNLDIAGILAPVNTVNISSKISGQVQSLDYDTGSSVKAGDVLITLETKMLDAQLRQAEAALQQAEAAAKSAAGQQSQAKINLDTAQKAYDRIKGLFGSGAASQSQLDDAASKLDMAKKQYETASGSAQEQARAAVSTSQANINSIKVQMEGAIITSPISGVITNRNINPGEIATPGAPLLTIADTSSLVLKGTVPQEALPRLKEGQGLDVQVDIYQDRVFKGRIDSIGPVAVSTGEYFPIEISVPNDGTLKAGLSSHVTINLKQDALTVPVSSVVENNGESYVFVVKNGTVARRVVKTGFRNDREIEILKGLEAGEQVASTNVHSLVDNMPVDVN